MISIDNIDDLNKNISMFFNINIAVIHGGDKHKEGAVINVVPYRRSFKDYKIVANDIKNSLNRIGFNNVSLFSDDMNIIDNLQKNDIDLVWLNTGGTQGKNPMSHTPSILEMLGIPYVGHSPLATSILDSKHIFKHMCESLNIKTSIFSLWNERDLGIDDFIQVVKKKFKKGPFIAKPISGRASLSVYHAKNLTELRERCIQIFEETNTIVMVERFLGGAEYCVAVKGGVVCRGGEFSFDDHAFSFSEVERVLEDDELIFTSMDTKKITKDRTRLLDFYEDYNLKQELGDIAKSIHKGLNLNTLIRVDIRADSDGVLYVLEANPKPDLKETEGDVISLVTIGLEEQGLSYDDLIYSLFANTIYSYFINDIDLVKHIQKKISV